MSTQESAAPKRRSSAANRRRSSQARPRRAPETPVAESQAQASTASVTNEAPARAETAREAPVVRDRQQARAEARQQAKKASETPARRRFINTDRFEGLQRFYRETLAEVKKVNWPDQETTRNLTLVVIGLSVVLGLLLGGIDYVLFQLFEALP